VVWETNSPAPVIISIICLRCGRLDCGKPPYKNNHCPDPVRKRMIGIKTFNLSHVLDAISRGYCRDTIIRDMNALLFGVSLETRPFKKLKP